MVSETISNMLHVPISGGHAGMARRGSHTIPCCHWMKQSHTHTFSILGITEKFTITVNHHYISSTRGESQSDVSSKLDYQMVEKKKKMNIPCTTP